MSTLTTLQRQTREVLDDQGTPPQWGDSDVIKAINWACVEIARATGVSYVEATATLTTGSAPLPSDAISVERVFVRLT